MSLSLGGLLFLEHLRLPSQRQVEINVGFSRLTEIVAVGTINGRLVWLVGISW